MTKAFLTVLAIATFLIVAASSAGATLRVDIDSTATTPDGSTWGLAFLDLQDALNVADEDDEIWVADGTYVPTVRTDPLVARSVSFVMVPDVKIVGGFQGLSRSGGGETVKSQRNPELYETILSGNIGDEEEADDNAFHVVTADGTSITDSAQLNGFTIRDGYNADATDGPLSGGAGLIVLNGASPVTARCLFTVNFSQSWGGATRVVDSENPSNAQFLSCTWAYNETSGKAGGLFVSGGSATLVNCLAHHNVAGQASFLEANTTTGDLVLINCTVTQNSGAISALYAHGSTGSVINCLLYDNDETTAESVEDAQITTQDLALDVINSDIKGLNLLAGNNNIDVDPLFTNPGHDVFSLQYLSTVLNHGDPADVPQDVYDIDDDSDTSELLPDRSMAARQVNPTACIDLGAFEEQTAESCYGDITDAYGGGPDGEVDVNDMNLVLASWAGPGGVADLAPASCGNGVVNVNDYLAVVNAWGSCSESFGGSESLTGEQVIAMLLEQLAEHPEWEVQIEAVIAHVLEHGL